MEWLWLVPVGAIALCCWVSRLRDTLISKDGSWWRKATVADVKAALDKGANVNASSMLGMTPLRYAAHYTTDSAITKLLIDRGAVIDPCSSKTSLHEAIDAGNLAAVATLLDNGAGIQKQSYGAFPLHHATKPDIYCVSCTMLHSKDTSILTLLLDRGADIEARAADDYTPLHEAVRAGNLAAVTVLLTRGANINAQCSLYEGSTALEIAIGQGNFQIVESLLHRDADSTLLPDDYYVRSSAVRDLLIRYHIKIPIYEPQQRESRRRQYRTVEAERRRRPAKYTISAIPTMFDGRQYRSRLEARWAAFMSLCGWEHEYEPLDLNGWIPDFAIWGQAGNTVWVEIKPVVAFPRDVAQKMEDGLPIEYRERGDELLIFGTKPSPAPRSASSGDKQPRLGWLARTVSSSESQRWTWGDCFFGRWAKDAPFGFCYPSRPYHDRITGTGSGVRGGSPGATDSDLARLWAEAGNLVQWQVPRDT